MYGRVHKGALQRVGCHLLGAMAKRILIVDDSELVRQLIRTFLEAQPDFEVCGEAAHGVEAAEKALQLKPDLIILDFPMPQMSGLEVALALQPTMPAIPKILFTAHKGVVPEHLAHTMGITSVLSKSEGIDGLITEVQRLLEPSQAAASSSSI